MTPPKYRNIIRYLNQFEAVVRADETKGSLPPEDWQEIEAEYERVRAKLRDWLLKL